MTDAARMTHYRGRPIANLTRGELIEALQQTATTQAPSLGLMVRGTTFVPVERETKTFAPGDGGRMRVKGGMP